MSAQLRTRNSEPNGTGVGPSPLIPQVSAVKLAYAHESCKSRFKFTWGGVPKRCSTFLQEMEISTTVDGLRTERAGRAERARR